MRISASHRQPAGARRQRGMTLIELMIVLVIVGILMAVGYPAYVGYSDRARRSDGKALLMDAAARMERYYFDNNKYSSTLSELGYASGTVSSSEGHYTLGAAAGATGSINTSYALTATPTYTESALDCGNLTLDSVGAQGVSGSDSVADCWGR